MHKSLHASDDIDSLYMSRKEREKELNSVEYGVVASIWELKIYIKQQRKTTFSSQ